jgi:uncharacterized membrane protein
MKRFLSSMMFRGGIAALIVLVSLATIASAQTITTLDAPNSINTIPQAINIFGQIAGYYQHSNGHQFGFQRRRDGTFTSFSSYPEIPEIPTSVTGMNLSGEIIGYTVTATDDDFLRQPDGTIIHGLVPPSSTASATMAAEPSPTPEDLDGSIPYAINAVGQITGAYGRGPRVGYLREPDGSGVLFTVGTGLFTLTLPRSINLFGQITGSYLDSSSSMSWNGFLRQPNGRIITFGPLGSVLTRPTSINLTGHIAGHYSTADGTYHGFLREPNGKIVTFDPAGSIQLEVEAINLEGQITGFYATVDGVYHGFLRKKDGRIVSFDAPGAANAGTFPKDINDLGQIVGYYQDANSALHGFLRNAW